MSARLGRTLRVSGKTYSAAIEGSGVPTEENWPEPTLRHVGRGLQYRYDNLTGLQYHAICSHLIDLADSFLNGDDDETRADGRAIRNDLRRAGQWA